MSPEQKGNSSTTCATEAPASYWWEVIIDFTDHLKLIIVMYFDSRESNLGVSWTHEEHVSQELVTWIQVCSAYEGESLMTSVHSTYILPLSAQDVVD